MTASPILDQFDRCAEKAEFPDLENGYYYPVEARMRLFGDPSRWAVLVELVGYNPRAGSLVDVVHRFGNCLLRGTPGFGDFLDRVDNMADLDPDGSETYAGGVPVVVRGVPLAVGAAAGTPLQDVFRLLAEDHRELLLADGAETRADVPADLPELLQLDAWHQPEDSWDTPPSTQETYRLVAAVLESGDAGRYRPTLAPNTHWSHWPDAGTL